MGSRHLALCFTAEGPIFEFPRAPRPSGCEGCSVCGSNGNVLRRRFALVREAGGESGDLQSAGDDAARSQA